MRTGTPVFQLAGWPVRDPGGGGPQRAATAAQAVSLALAAAHAARSPSPARHSGVGAPGEADGAGGAALGEQGAHQAGEAEGWTRSVVAASSSTVHQR